MSVQRRLLMAFASFAIMAEAAPQTVLPVEQAPYHVPVFSNELVTVLNVIIPPNSTSGYHRHSLDTLGVLIGDTARTRQLLGESTTSASEPRPSGSVSFSFYKLGPVVHSVTVTGSEPFHNIVVELLAPSPSGYTPRSRDGAPGYTEILSNERIRAWRLVLEPGEQAPEITQSAPGIRIVIDGGAFVESVPGRPDRGIALRRGDFYWQDADVTRAVRNSGTTRIELVEVEIK